MEAGVNYFGAEADVIRTVSSAKELRHLGKLPRRRQQLTNEKYPLKQGLYLLEAMMGITMLYECESWIPKLD